MFSSWEGCRVGIYRVLRGSGYVFGVASNHGTRGTRWFTLYKESQHDDLHIMELSSGAGPDPRAVTQEEPGNQPELKRLSELLKEEGFELVWRYGSLLVQRETKWPQAPLQRIHAGYAESPFDVHFDPGLQEVRAVMEKAAPAASEAVVEPPTPDHYGAW